MRVLLAGPDYEENLSIRYLSASLLSAGHITTLAAFNSADALLRVANAAQGVDIVGLSMCFQSRAPEFLRLAQQIKSRNPSTLIVAGGHYASCAAEPLLANHPEIDIIAIHEGERTLVEIAGALSHLKERLPYIPGIAYRRDEHVCFTNPRPTLNDLDILPFPDRSGPIHNIAGVPTSYMMGSRGCYGSCAYCCITTLHRMAPGKRFRQRKVESITDEMAALYHERGTRQFVFHDDNFLVPSVALNRARLSAFENALRVRGIDEIALVIKCRPADVNRSVFRRLKELGLVRVFLGIESATEQGLSVLERKQSVEDSIRALETCADLDISAQFTMMIFNPDTTLDTLRADVAFMRRFCGNPLNFCRTEIYVGTPLERRMIELGRARGNYLARVYDLLDPAADLACKASLDLFRSRCWDNGSLMQRTIGLDHLAAVSKRFYSGRGEVCQRVANWVRAVNHDTIGLLTEVIELSTSNHSFADHGFHRALLVLRERELAMRQKFLLQGSRLRSELEAPRFINEPSEIRSFSGARFSRQVAAALLVASIPATTGCKSAQDKGQTAPTPTTPPPQRYFGISEMAAPPLKPGILPPSAEVNLCSITGTVTDASGVVVANATVEIIDLNTKQKRTLKTNEAGQYVANGLHQGRYDITIKAPGFKIIEVKGILLKIGDHKQIDLVLEVGSFGCCEYAALPLTEPEPQPPTLPEVITPRAFPELQATTPSCSLTGTITDPSGAVIANATVTITNVDTGQMRTLTTDASGQYSASNLPDGQYAISAKAQGFTETRKTGIVLKAGDHTSADIALKIVVNLTLDVNSSVSDYGCCEYAATPLEAKNEDLIAKKKPFMYTVGDAKDHNTYQGIAKLVYGTSKAWVQIFEANRDVTEKPGPLENGWSILIPPRKRPVPKLVFKVKPTYPPEAITSHVRGDVVMDVTLKDDGTVDRVDLIDGPPLLVEAARDAVRQWRYRPLLVQGKPVTKFVVVVSFGKRSKVH